MRPPCREQGLERALLGDRQVRPVRIGRLDQDIEIADRAKPSGDLAETLPVSLRPLGPERLAEDPPRGPLAAGRDAHGVEVLRRRAVAGAGLPGDHPGEMEPEDLAAGLGKMVVGEDARGLADDEAGPLMRSRLVATPGLRRGGGGVGSTDGMAAGRGR